MTKISFETAALADAIKRAERIAPSRGQAFDQAAGILIQLPAVDQPALIRSTNLEIFCTEWVDTAGVEGEPVTWRLPSGPFATVIKSLPIGSGKTVTIEEITKDFSTQIHVTQGRVKARFNTLDPEYFPEWEIFDPEVLTPAKDFGGRIGQVAWACASRDSPPISGIHIDGVNAYATDRYKMTVVPLPIENFTHPVTLPSELLPSLLRETGDISIGMDGGTFLIMPDDFTQIKCVTFEGAYPPFGKVMEREFDQEVPVNKTEILDMLRRAEQFAGTDRMPTLRMFIGEEEIRAMMSNDEVGVLGDVLEAPGSCQHDMWEIKFTPKNIIGALDNAPNEKLTIRYSPGEKRPMLKIEGGSGYTAWVAPRNETKPAEPTGKETS